MSNANTTGSGATIGSSGEQSVGRTRVIQYVVVIILAVLLLVILAWVWNSWRVAHAEQEGDQVAVLRKLTSDAVSAANDADKAIYNKLNADKVLFDRIQAEQSAESKAAEDEAKAEKLKSEKSDKAAEQEEIAKASRVAANEAMTERKKAETAVLSALEALSDAKDSLKGFEVWNVSAIFPPKLMAFFGLFLLLVSLFPLSAYAYNKLEVPSLQAQLKIDYQMLGSQGRELPSPSTGNSPSAGTGDSTPSNRWDGISYCLHGGLAVLATAAGASLFFRAQDGLLNVDTQHGMQLGFLGAYVFCLNVVYRRYTTRDLEPHVYLSCAVGLIAGMIFNYVAFTAITSVATTSPEGFTGVGAGAAAILAFSLGYFPNLAIRWFGRISRTSVHERQRRSDALPLALIDGISELHESRLQDAGIDNVQNLAAVDIRAMVEKTPFSAHQIVEWVDQAVLYLYVDPGEIESFRKAGVRSVSDFRDIWNGFSIQYKLQPDGTTKRVPIITADSKAEFDERRKSIAAQLATTEQRLDCLFRATAEGPNMERVRTYWSNCQNAAIESRNLLINQVCGSVGRALRESMRDSETLTPNEILNQVAEELFLVAPNNVEPGAESLYGKAYLKKMLGLTVEQRELLVQCTEDFPEDAVAFNDLAWLDLQNRSRRCALETARTNARKAVELAGKTGKGVPGSQRSEILAYTDTLALAEIRLGNLQEGVELEKGAIREWDNLGRSNQPMFLETLMSAAEGYLSKGNREEAKGVLDFVVQKNYANEKTKERIVKMQKALAAKPPAPAPDQALASDATADG